MKVDLLKMFDEGKMEGTIKKRNWMNRVYCLSTKNVFINPKSNTQCSKTEARSKGMNKKMIKATSALEILL